MKEKHIVKIVVSVIALIGIIVTAIFNFAKKEDGDHSENNNYVMVKIGENQVSLDDDEAQAIIVENGNLKNEQSNYEEQIEEYEKTIENLMFQNEKLNLKLNEIPAIEYKDFGFYINGEEQPINKNKSFATINGAKYYSEDFINALLPENSSLTVKDNNVYIGRIVSDKANLFNIKVMDSKECSMKESLTDSYGNMYSNVLYFDTYWNNEKYIIYVLDGKYSLMKFSVAIRDDASMDKKGVITIDADGETVYSSEVLNKTTRVFTVDDLPINNCSLLTIKYTNEGNIDCIISDAFVYN